MVNFKVNGQKVVIPSSWQEVKFNLYCEVLKGKADLLKIVSIASGLNYETVKNATVIGLESVIQALNFLNTIPEVPGYTPTVGKYNLANTKDGKFDIQFESLAQFEDMRIHLNKIAIKDQKYDIVSLTETYAVFVAIYLQKIRDGKYNPEAAQAMILEVYEMPALEVISAGSFFFLKLLSLSSGTTKASPLTKPNLKKLKRVSIGSRKRSVPTARSRKRR